MERSRNGTLMSLNSQDVENLESVKEPYFGERETEDNQERAFTFSIQILWSCLLYTSPSPRDGLLSRMPSSA